MGTQPGITTFLIFKSQPFEKQLNYQRSMDYHDELVAALRPLRGKEGRVKDEATWVPGVCVTVFGAGAAAQGQAGQVRPASHRRSISWAHNRLEHERPQGMGSNLKKDLHHQLSGVQRSSTAAQAASCKIYPRPRVEEEILPVRTDYQPTWVEY